MISALRTTMAIKDDALYVKPNCTLATHLQDPYSRRGRRKASVGSFIPWGIKVQIFKRQRERQSLYTFSPVTSAKLRCHLSRLFLRTVFFSLPLSVGEWTEKKRKSRRGKIKRGKRRGAEERRGENLSGRSWRSLVASRRPKVRARFNQTAFIFLRGALRQREIGILCG